MFNASLHSRTVRIAILSVLMIASPACSANAGSKRKLFGSEPAVNSAPPSGRFALRPPGYSWWNQPKQFYLQGYAGTNYDLRTRNQLRETRYQRKSNASTGHLGHGH